MRSPRPALALLAPLVTLASTLAARQAAADVAVSDGEDTNPTTLDHPIRVQISRDGAVAKLSAHFTARVHGPNETVFDVPLPAGAVITAASVTTGAGEAHQLALLDAETAFTAKEAILATAPGNATRRWGTLISTSTSGTFGASVSVVAPHDAWLGLDLELQLPTCYFEDARYAEVPIAWQPSLPTAMRAKALPKTLHETCFTNAAADGTPSDTAYFALPAPELSHEPAGAARIGIATARVSLATQHVAEVEVNLASKLSTIPADLATAFVIDTSRSVTADEADTQRRIVLAYAHYAPASRVQVIAYARKARPVLPAWSLASAAAPRIDRELQHVVEKNGSNAFAGLAEAGAWLSRVSGTRRVVLFTDERLPDALAKLEASELAAPLPPGTVVHVVALSTGAGLARDETQYGGLAELTEGISVRGSIGDDPSSALQLVRPISLERLAIDAPGWKLAQATSSCPTDAAADAQFASRADEGRGCVWQLIGEPVAGPVTVTGMLWGHAVTRVIKPDPTHATQLARELTGTSFGGDLATDADRTALLTAAHAINEKWSMFGTWGGSGGYADIARGGGSGFMSGDIGGGSHDIGIGTGGHGTQHTQFSMAAQLRAGLMGCVGIERNRVEATVETTLEEIVGLDVKVVPSLSPTETPAILAQKQQCADEALWEVSLSLHDPASHAVTQLVL